MRLSIIVLSGCLALSPFLAPAGSVAAEFPSQPIHMWAGFAAGGGVDLLCRTISKVAEKNLGQPIVVENKEGAGGALCLGLLASEKANGYTLATVTDNPFTRAPHMFRVKYDPTKDFAPIIRIGIQTLGIVVRSDSSFKKFQDLVEYARKNPKKMTYGTPSAAGNVNFLMETVALREKVQFQNVPFNGDAGTISAVLGGHVMAAGGAATGWISHVKTGGLRLLLKSDESESGVDPWPDVPASTKLGYTLKWGPTVLITAPKGLPDLVLDKLVAVFSQAMMSPEYQQMARDQQISHITAPLTGSDLNNSLQEQFKIYGAVIKELGLQKKQ